MQHLREDAEPGPRADKTGTLGMNEPLQIGIGIEPATGLIHVAFDQAVKAFCLTPVQARELSQQLRMNSKLGLKRQKEMGQEVPILPPNGGPPLATTRERQAEAPLYRNLAAAVGVPEEVLDRMMDPGNGGPALNDGGEVNP